MLSVIALASDSVLTLMVDTLECVEVTGRLALALLANCGTAVTDVVVEEEVERVTRVVVLNENGGELMELEGDEDDEDDAEVVILDVAADGAMDGGEEGGVLATGWLLVLLEGGLIVIDDCIDIEGGGGGVPLDDELGKTPGLKAMENAFAGQAQAQLHA